MTKRRGTILEKSRLRAHFESGFKPAREFGIGLEYERFGVIARPRAGASALGDPLPLDGPVSMATIFDL